MLTSRKLGAVVLGLMAAALWTVSSSRAVEPDKMVPADAEMIMAINVRQASIRPW